MQHGCSVPGPDHEKPIDCRAMHVIGCDEAQIGPGAEVFAGAMDNEHSLLGSGEILESSTELFPTRNRHRVLVLGIAQGQIADGIAIGHGDKRGVHSVEDNSTTLRAVGFNPFRKQRKTAVDLVIVAVFIALIVAVVAWGFLG